MHVMLPGYKKTNPYAWSSRLSTVSLIRQFRYHGHSTLSSWYSGKRSNSNVRYDYAFPCSGKTVRYSLEIWFSLYVIRKWYLIQCKEKIILCELLRLQWKPSVKRCLPKPFTYLCHRFSPGESVHGQYEDCLWLFLLNEIQGAFLQIKQFGGSP